MDGKRLREAKKSIDRAKLYPVEQAVKLIKERAKAKFDETIEIAMNLGVDPRHADQIRHLSCVGNVPEALADTFTADKRLRHLISSLSPAAPTHTPRADRRCEEA